MDQAEQFAQESVRSVGSLMTLGFRLVSLNSHISQLISLNASLCLCLSVCLSVRLSSPTRLSQIISLNSYFLNSYFLNSYLSTRLSVSVTLCLYVCLSRSLPTHLSQLVSLSLCLFS